MHDLDGSKLIVREGYRQYDRLTQSKGVRFDREGQNLSCANRVEKRKSIVLW
jgi:hypothetical protein